MPAASTPTTSKRQQPPKRSRGGTQPTPLSRDDILDAALPLVARDGLDSLTVKAIADALGVSSPAVYHYIDGRDELVDRLCERVAREIDLDTTCSAAWDDAIVIVLLNMHHTFSRYPGVGGRVLATQRRSRAADRVSDKVLDLVLTEGYSAADALDLLASLHFLFGGWLLGTRPLRPAQPLQPELLERTARWVLAGFANTVAKAAPAPNASGTDHGDHP
ncbi:MAG: TetR/AcrR family transcriptional regulator [Actinomycetota bacterium]|nr:TetR/AcrR family transcriptional regulator [Actinomycetota bacterium]